MKSTEYERVPAIHLTENKYPEYAWNSNIKEQYNSKNEKILKNKYGSEQLVQKEYK